MTLKKAIERHKSTILFCLILVFGSILRLVQLGNVPGGYQMDEAYGAFNAYSLFHSGIYSTGHSYPCLLYTSWSNMDTGVIKGMHFICNSGIRLW